MKILKEGMNPPWLDFLFWNFRGIDFEFGMILRPEGDFLSPLWDTETLFLCCFLLNFDLQRVFDSVSSSAAGFNYIEELILARRIENSRKFITKKYAIAAYSHKFTKINPHEYF